MHWSVAVFILVTYVIYDRLSWINLYWKNRGVPGPRPRLFIGNMLENILGRKSFGELCVKWSQEWDYAPLLGLYNFVKPFLMVQSPEYVETVLVKEFSHFADRAPPPPSNVNLSDQFLFIATGSKWKALRTKLSPVFTSGKLKKMVPGMKGCFRNVRNKLDADSGQAIRGEDFIQTFIIDVTAEIVFGIESSDLSDANSEFRRMSQKMFRFNWKRFLCFVLYFIFPKLAAIFKIPFVPTEQTGYFQRIIRETWSRRKASGLIRNDIVQLLSQLKDKGSVDVETLDEADDYLDIAENKKTTDTIEMTEELLTSQAMIFMTTGFDTVSTVLTFTLVEVTMNPSVMDKLVQEINSVLERHMDFTYDALKDMKYLDMCLKESMRLHPPIPAFLRYCTKSYTFDNGTTVDKGTMLVIPVLSVHTDPNVYADPLSFIPERFLTPPRPGSYLPFGEGPRICMAKRFAMLEMKMLLCRLLHRYELHLHRKTQLPVLTEKWNFLSKPNSQVYFKVTRRRRP